MADRHDSEILRGFGDGLTDRRTFAILESLLRLITQKRIKSLKIAERYVIPLVLFDNSRTEH